MAENDTLKPLDDGDVIPAAATDALLADPEPAVTPPRPEPALALGNGASFQQQATDRLRTLAEDGLDRAGDVLDQVAQLLRDAAAQVDDKLGAQYGDHARTAAQTVEGFATSVREKDVDELAADVRGYIRKSPGAAVGVTAALGFALSRLVHAGLDQRT